MLKIKTYTLLRKTNMAQSVANREKQMFMFESTTTKCAAQDRKFQQRQVHSGQKASAPLLPDQHHTGGHLPRLRVPRVPGHQTELLQRSCPSLKSSNTTYFQKPLGKMSNAMWNGQTCKQFTETKQKIKLHNPGVPVMAQQK